MFGAIAGGIASALAGGAMSKLFGGGQKAASGGIQGDVLATDNNTVGMGDRSEERRVGKECRSRGSPMEFEEISDRATGNLDEIERGIVRKRPEVELILSAVSRH